MQKIALQKPLKNGLKVSNKELELKTPIRGKIVLPADTGVEGIIKGVMQDEYIYLQLSGESIFWPEGS